MASAGSSVFVIPEILENILANIDNFYDLFTMQCVSRTFQTTIDGSITLRRKMGLLARDMPEDVSQEGEAALLGQVHPLLYPINKLDFHPYTRRFDCPFDECVDGMKVKADEPYIEAFEDPKYQGVEYGPLPWERSDYTYGFMLGFLLRPGSTDDKYLLDSSFKLGYTRDHGKDGATHPYGSWRSVRVSLVQKPVRVGVYVRVPRSICKKKGIKGQFSYWVIRLYENGEVTLGEIVDRLEEVRSRTYEQHFQKWEGPDKCHMKRPCGGLRFDEDSDDGESNHDGYDSDGRDNNEYGDDRDEGDQIERREDGDEAEEVEETTQTQGPAADTWLS